MIHLVRNFFRKTDISYPLICTRGKKRWFFGKFWVHTKWLSLIKHFSFACEFFFEDCTNICSHFSLRHLLLDDNLWINLIDFLKLTSYPNLLNTERKLKVHKMFRWCPGRLLNVLCTFNLCPLFKWNIFPAPSSCDYHATNVII